MSTLGIMTTLLATSLCDAVRRDEHGEGLDISAGLFGDETTKFIKDTATTINELSAQSSELQVKYDRLLVLLNERDKSLSEVDARNNPATAAIQYALNDDEGIEFLRY